ncbi:MAG: SAM-dependent methyltransferase [Trebonia sp.]
MEQHPSWNSADPDQGASRRLPAGLDVSTPNVARMYDYFLDGKDNFAADRDAGDKILALVPAVRRTVRENRRFLRRAVRFLAAEAGIRQFLDIGVGLPTQGAVHEVAHEINPETRVAYVDYDPVVVSHGNALLAEPDQSIVVRADLRQPGALLSLPAIREHLDFSRPVAVLLVAILHFVADVDDPGGIVASLRDALAPGSYLVLTHVGNDRLADTEAAERVRSLYAESSEPLWARSREEILRFFDGFELVEPGLVPAYEWRPVIGEAPAGVTDFGWGGVGRKA